MDFTGLNTFLLSYLSKVLMDLQPGGRVNGNEYECATIHGGKGNSCKTNIRTGVGSDFATGQKWSDVVSLYAEQQQIKQSESYQQLSEMYNYNHSELPKHPKNGQASKFWTYHDANGNPSFYIARYETPEGKVFSPITPKHPFGYSFRGPAKPYPLYDLHLLTQHKDKPVLIVEGEKACEAAKTLLDGHYVVTTWPFGSQSIANIDVSPLYGRKILLWPDADRKIFKETDRIPEGLKAGDIKPYEMQPGPSGMLSLSERIVQKAQYVKIINVGIDLDRQDGWDAADAISQGWKLSDFIKWAKENVKVINPLQYSEQQTDTKIAHDDSQNETKMPKQIGYEAERTLTFANKICTDNILAYNETTDTLYRYKDGYYQTIKHGKRGSKLSKMIIDMDRGETLTVSARANVMSNIETLSYVDNDIFDNSVINFKNGLFDPEKMEFFDHTPNVISTNRIPYNYEPQAKCDLWLSFLNDILDDDISKIDILQEFVGYCFIRTCKYEKALFIPGGGQNGKGTFTSTIYALFGGGINVSAANLEQIADDVRRSAILNKYVNIDTEIPKRAERYESAFKQAVSGEEMLFNEKYIAPYSVAPFCKFIFSTNKMPRIDEGTMGFYRRMIIIPFIKTISDEKKDVNLKHKLKQELPGIFNWAMEGLRRLVKNDKFTDNKNSEDAIYELRKDNNVILQFAEDKLIFHGNQAYGVQKKHLYDTYREWCKDNGHMTLSYRRFNSDFYDEFQKHTFKDLRNGRLPGKDRYWPCVSRAGSYEFGECGYDDISPSFED